MEALLCEKLGDPVVPITSPASPITLAKTHPIPSLTSPTSVRVRVHATSLNYANYLQILGKYQEKPPLPFIPGSDYSGVVEAVGEAVSRFKVGDRVCSVAGLGSFAEFIVDDEKDLWVYLVWFPVHLVVQFMNLCWFTVEFYRIFGSINVDFLKKNIKFRV